MFSTSQRMTRLLAFRSYASLYIYMTMNALAVETYKIVCGRFRNGHGNYYPRMRGTTDGDRSRRYFKNLHVIFSVPAGKVYCERCASDACNAL